MADGPKTGKFTHFKNGGYKHMKRNVFNLQLFDDGGQGNAGAGTTGAGAAGTGDGGQAGNTGATGGQAGGYSFAQAEEIANARASRAEKAALSAYFKQQGMTEEQVTEAINTFRAQQAAKAPNVDALTRERDEARAEVEALKNAQKLTAKGVKSEDSDYVLFKINAMLKEDDKLDFDKALAKFLKDNPRFGGSGSSYRVRTGTGNSDQGSGQQTTNDSINDAIRRAARR